MTLAAWIYAGISVLALYLLGNSVHQWLWNMNLDFLSGRSSSFSEIMAPFLYFVLPAAMLLWGPVIAVWFERRYYAYRDA